MPRDAHPAFGQPDGAVRSGERHSRDTGGAGKASDGTLYVEDGIPYIVYSHEWLQVKDGEMCARRLSDDLTEAVGEPILLFRASGPSWAKAINDDGAYVADGPFLYRTESGRLLMLWASFSKDGYAEAIAYSETTGKSTGSGARRRKTSVLARRRARDGVPRP